MTYQDLCAKLKPFDQTHVLAFWDKLSPDEQQSLSEQIEALDLARLQQEFSAVAHAENWAELAARAEAPPAMRLAGERNRFTPEAARSAGEAALRAGKIGAILVAGGQGTRLGFDQPKGMYPIGPVSHATLFQIHFERLLARARWAGRPIPLAIMTSPATDAATRDFLKQHHFFGMPEQDIFIFCQGTMPAVDAETGKLLLAAPAELALSPDGHGGMLSALDRSGVLRQLQARGIEELFYFQIDNPLVAIGDPIFIGYHLLAQSELTTQVINKQTAREKVGNVIQVDGHLRIIEYSDLNPLPDEIVERRQADGSFLFWAGSIAVHLMNVPFLARLAHSAAGLPFHIARKAVPYLDSQGQRVVPTQPNAIKFERFIFDLLPNARNGIVIEVDEEQAFAPLKNAPGEPKDTPEYVQRLMMNQHRQWLQAAGAQVAPTARVEISPLFAQDPAEVAARIQPGRVISDEEYLR